MRWYVANNFANSGETLLSTWANTAVVAGNRATAVNRAVARTEPDSLWAIFMIVSLGFGPMYRAAALNARLGVEPTIPPDEASPQFPRPQATTRRIAGD